jgi:hypothetical protein
MATLSLRFGHVRPMAILLVKEFWVFAYLIGAPIGLFSGAVFCLLVDHFRRADLLIAISAALIVVSAVSILTTLSTLRSQGFSFSSFTGVPDLTIAAVAAITVCWFVARVMRYIQY